MDIERTDIDGVVILTPRRFGDDRGFFSETFSDAAFRGRISDVTFVQDNHSRSAAVGTIRGLHFQAPPRAQGKLVRVTRGAVVDVAVDIRRGSPTYGRHVRVELSEENWRQLWVPPGFAHGFCTLRPGTEVQYKVTDLYAPETEGGLAWDDPGLRIDWGIDTDAVEPTLSDRDRRWPGLADLDSPFA